MSFLMVKQTRHTLSRSMFFTSSIALSALCFRFYRRTTSMQSLQLGIFFSLSRATGVPLGRLSTTCKSIALGKRTGEEKLPTKKKRTTQQRKRNWIALFSRVALLISNKRSETILQINWFIPFGGVRVADNHSWARTIALIGICDDFYHKTAKVLNGTNRKTAVRKQKKISYFTNSSYCFSRHYKKKILLNWICKFAYTSRIMSKNSHKRKAIWRPLVWQVAPRIQFFIDSHLTGLRNPFNCAALRRCQSRMASTRENSLFRTPERRIYPDENQKYPESLLPDEKIACRHSDIQQFLHSTEALIPSFHSFPSRVY